MLFIYCPFEATVSLLAEHVAFAHSSHVISSITTPLTSAMTSASNLYIAHSTPFTLAPNSISACPQPTTPSSKSSSSNTPQSQSQSQSHGNPLAPPSHILLLQSPMT